MKPEHTIDRYAVLNIARQIYFAKAIEWNRGKTPTELKVKSDFNKCIEEAESIVEVQKEYMKDE